MIQILVEKTSHHSRRSLQQGTKSKGQTRDKPGKSDLLPSDTSPSPSGRDADKSMESVSSESDIDRNKHDSVYGAVWFASSGNPVMGNQEPELSVAGGQDVYEVIPESSDSNSRKPSFVIEERQNNVRNSFYSIQSRIKVCHSMYQSQRLHHHPLPPGTQLENFTKAAIAQATAQNRPPPAVPPRPKNVPSLGSRSGSTSSLTQ